MKHTVTDRGFTHMEPVRGTDNNEVRVYESSAVHSYWPEHTEAGSVTQGEAEGPFIWLRVKDDAGEAAAHLPIDAARTVRDQLSYLIDRA